MSILLRLASIGGDVWYYAARPGPGAIEPVPATDPLLGWLRTLRWTRVPGGTVFAIGAIAIVVFVFGLRFGWSLKGVEPR